MTVTLKNPDESMLEKAGEDMRNGMTCIYPTETCYGLGTNPLDREAIEKIRQIKNRPEEKKLSCIAASIEMAEEYCLLSEEERELCEEFMPGPLTLVTEKKDKVPDLLNDKFVFRISSNKKARKLSESAEVPVVSTSANLSGAPSPYSIKDISRLVKEKVEYIIDAGELEPTDPSTVLELEDGEPKILREGPVSEGQIQKFL